MAKDANRPVVTLISESHEEVVFRGDTIRGQGPLIPDNKIMAYPDIPDMAHEFAARLRFGTTFELMEFLAQQQLTLTQRMADKHVNMQMIQRALAGTAERTEGRALDKIGRMRNADEGRIGIELPPLNTALVEVHRELATVRHGAKDMVTKNKRLKKKEKYTQGQLAEAQRRISELEEQYEEASASADTATWHLVMELEMNSIRANKTWDLVKLPKNRRALPCKWVYRLKEMSDSTNPKYNGVDFDEMFSPMVKMTTLRFMLGVVAADNLELIQLDVKTTFLHGDLQEEIYMEQPKGFMASGQEHLVC